MRLKKPAQPIPGAHRLGKSGRVSYHSRPRCPSFLTRMQILTELLPLFLFFAAYLHKDLYFALIVLMVAMPVGLFLKYLKTRKVDPMYMWSTIFLLVLGSATLYFQNKDFLFWKPTAFYWAVALAFTISMFVGSKPLVRRFFDMTAALPTDRLEPAEWRKLNVAWIAFFIVAGLLNIYVAYNFSESFWVKFKVFGLLVLTFLFILAQSFWLMSKLGGTEAESESGENK